MTNRIKPYTTKAGAQQFKPSIQLLEELSDDDQGFCLACGNTVDGVEPDARRDVCPDCGASKVYGAEELALMGLCFNEETV